MRERTEMEVTRSRKTKHQIAITTVLVVLIVSLPVEGFVLYHNLRLMGISTSASTPTQYSVTGPSIIRENAHPGTGKWVVSIDKSHPREIQAYASAPSVYPNQRLTFYVSVARDGTPYIVEIYRLGWYGGTGGRLMLTFHELGQSQGYYDEDTHTLINCRTCYFDPSDGLTEANWSPSFSLTIPHDWLTGVYLAKFSDNLGRRTYVLFDVKGNPYSTYLVVTPDTTTQAYNDWGGYSLYQGPDGSEAHRARKVSFDRPLAHSGFGAALPYEINEIRWLERQGYDVSYISSVDLNNDPEQLLNHAAYISLGHDEYWSKAMRDGVETARDHGVNLLFFGADAADWQIRFEPDTHGNPDRTVVCYRVASEDPLHGIDNAHLTVAWRDPPVSRPENGLIGMMFSDLAFQGIDFPWYLNASDVTSPLLSGTGLIPGQPYGCDIVGHEWDRVFANGATPPHLVILGHSPTTGVRGNPDVSDTTYYIDRSGALVFATGSLNWEYALDNLRLLFDPYCPNASVIPGIQKLTANVMNALAIPGSFRLGRMRSAS